MTKLTQRIALIAMMLVLAVGGAMAQPDRGQGGDRGGDNRGQDMLLRRCLGTLELNDDQKAAIAAIQTRIANLEESTRAEIEALNQRLRTAREAGDREAAMAIMEEIKSKNEALHAAHEAANAAILALLTPEQLAALRNCMGQRGAGDRGRHRGPDCFEQLDLSQDQLDAMQALRDAFKTEHGDAMQAVRELHKQLRDARKDGDSDAVAALRTQIAAAMESIKAAQEQLRQDILNVLTPEQLQALEDCREAQGDGDGGRRGGRRGMPKAGTPAPALH
jgi:Spy/CpxP family protein refolding chaperone